MAALRRKERDPEGRMSLGDHLRELRNRITKAGLAIIIAAIASWFLYHRVYEILRAPIDDYIAANPSRQDDIRLTVAGPTTAFSLQLTVSVFLGFLISSPVWLYQAWAFIVPGLTRKEKRISLAFLGAAVPLFLMGVGLAQVSLPLIMRVLLDFTPSDAANFQLLSEYFSFILRFMLAFGFAFLLPVFLVGLNMIGILPASRLIQSWRVSVFLIFVFSAIMMPTPDPYTMFLLAGPLIILFFGAYVVCRTLDKRKAKHRPDWLDVDDEQASSIEPAGPTTSP